MRDAAQYYRVLSSTTRNLAGLHVITDNLLLMEWEYEEDCVPTDTKTNIFIAAFTTAHARVRLYRELHQLGERVLYYDLR